jgi:hypothetical protein
MSSYQKWFFAALVAAAGAYFLVDANDSIRNLLSVLAFFVFALIGEIEVNKTALRETNKKLWEEIRALEIKIESLELDRQEDLI